MRILIAEDEPMSRLLLLRTLEQAGYEVVIAEDGKKAAEILCGDDAPRMALVDWMMPELNGPELCRMVRQRQHNMSYVYLIILTSRQNSEDVVAGLESGADDYLVKPCVPAELRARLRAGLRILELQDKLVMAREEMRHKATYDSLTGLRNRAAILSFARKALRRAYQSSRSPLLLLCDVDHFKQINDTHGHAAGDAVLQEVAHRLTNAVRADDAVGRYGGEEFLVVLNECDPATVGQRSQQILSAVASAPFTVGSLQLSLTISIGSIVSSDKDAQLDRLLAQADTALYRAKAEGRNRFAVAESAVPY